MALIELPEVLRSRLNPGAPVTPARDASTVVLLREAPTGLEVFLMRRQSTMSFAPGMYVFPGGSIHESDRDPAIAWVGPSAEEWGTVLGCDADHARGLVVAAARELFEEASILLAGSEEHVCDDAHSTAMQSARKVLDDDQLSLAAFLKESGYALRTDLLHAWSRWVTPEFEPKRFDTRFFVAKVPSTQQVGELSVEADHGEWMNLDDVIAGFEAGEVAMLPPTEMTIRSLIGLDVNNLAAVAAARSMEPIMPRLVEIDGKLFLEVTEDRS